MTVVIAKLFFILALSLLHFSVGIVLQGKTFTQPLFMYSVVYSGIDPQVLTNFCVRTMWLIPFIYLFAQIVPNLAIRNLFTLAPFSHVSIIFLLARLSFWYHIMFLAQLVHCLPQPWNQPSKQLLFLLLVTSIQKPKFGCCVCSLLMRCNCFQALSLDKAKKYMCTHTSIIISFL